MGLYENSGDSSMIFYYYKSLRGWAPCKAVDDAIVDGGGKSRLDEAHTKPVKLKEVEENFSLDSLMQIYPPPPEPAPEPKIKLV